MKKFAVLTAVAVMFGGQAIAGVWETQCAGCHNGALAPKKEDLKAKIKTATEFVEKAKKTNNPMMAPFKNNDQLLQQAAKEIYGK